MEKKSRWRSFIRFCLGSGALSLIVVAAMFWNSFGISRVHKVEMNGREITADDSRELRVSARLNTYDYLTWDDEIAGTVDVFDGDECVESLLLERRRDELHSKRSKWLDEQRELWGEKVWAHYNVLISSAGDVYSTEVVVDADMRWMAIVELDTLREGKEPRIWVFADKEHLASEIAAKAMAQYDSELQNPYE